jgi:hypothetical protein
VLQLTLTQLLALLLLVRLCMQSQALLPMGLSAAERALLLWQLLHARQA